VREIRREPVRRHLPLPQSLHEIAVETLACDRERTDERLVHKQLLASIGETAELGVPGVNTRSPLVGKPAERHDSRADVG